MCQHLSCSGSSVGGTAVLTAATPDATSLVILTLVRINSAVCALMADARFVVHSQVQLKGHRSVGGMRASVYNSMPIEGAKALADFMKVGLSTEPQLYAEPVSTDIAIVDHYLCVHRIVQVLHALSFLREPCAPTVNPRHEHAKHCLSCNLAVSQLQPCGAGLSEQTLISVVRGPTALVLYTSPAELFL